MSLALLFGIMAKDFVIKGMRDFYLFELDKTGLTRGIVLDARLDDAINGTSLECSYLYHVKKASFKIDESISVHDTIQRFAAGDSLNIRYNLDRPWKGTIDTSHNLSLFFATSFVLVIWFLWAIIFFITEAVRFFKACRNRNK